MLKSRNLLLAATAAMVVGLFTSTAEAKRPLLKKLMYDPDAPKKAMWDAIDDESISVRVIAIDANQGALLVENLSGAPLTIELPEGIVGVHVLPQADPFGIGGGAGAGGNNQNQGGQNQAMGGGMMGGMGGGMMGGMGGGMMGGMGGGGFFSIPAERTVRVPYRSVCLEHGKPEPNAHLTYKLVKPEEYTDNTTLQEIIKLVGTGKLDQSVAQAATWHIANNMSWEELAAKKFNRLGRPDTPYYTPEQLYAAQSLVSYAKELAADAEKIQPKTPETQSSTKTDKVSVDK